MKIFGYTIVNDEDYIHLVSRSKQYTELDAKNWELHRELAQERVARAIAQANVSDTQRAYDTYKKSVNEDKIAFKERMMEILAPSWAHSADGLIKYVDTLAEGVYDGENK